MKRWAYYNEIDPNAAAWIRELIKAGHITDGEVDERSIEYVAPSDLAGFIRCHFFAGIAVWDHALNLAGWGDRPVWTGSCPCQSFSTAGKGAGFNDERHLWPAYFHLIEQCRPATLFGEQVEAAIKHEWLDLVQSDLEGIGYAVGAACLPSAGVGAQDIRSRLWFVGRSGTIDRMADSGIEGLQRRIRGGSARTEESSSGYVAECCGYVAECCGVSQLVQPGESGLEGLAGHVNGSNQPGRIDAQQSRSVTATSVFDELGDPQCARCEGDGLQPVSDGRISGEPDARTTGSSTTIDMANTTSNRCRGDGSSRETEEGLQPRSEFTGELSDGFERFGPASQFWDAADWLYCRDDKWRAVESGTFPLVNGSTERMVRGSNSSVPFDANKTQEARVVRLKGYGNAINAELARIWVETCSTL